MSALPLRLDRYFFPHQEVRANPNFDAGSSTHESKVAASLGGAVIPGSDTGFTVEVTITLDEERSLNPPYFFKIQAFGIFTIADDAQADIAQQFANSAGATLLIGAIREHLAAMTARAPWGPFFLGLVQVQASITE